MPSDFLLGRFRIYNIFRGDVDEEVSCCDGVYFPDGSTRVRVWSVFGRGPEATKVASQESLVCFSLHWFPYLNE
jgi:hypothetical protein